MENFLHRSLVVLKFTLNDVNGWKHCCPTCLTPRATHECHEAAPVNRKATTNIF